MIHLTEFVPENVNPLPCSSGLVRHILLFVYFFTELNSFIGFFDQCNTSVFSALTTKDLTPQIPLAIY